MQRSRCRFLCWKTNLARWEAPGPSLAGADDERADLRLAQIFAPRKQGSRGGGCGPENENPVFISPPPPKLSSAIPAMRTSRVRLTRLSFSRRSTLGLQVSTRLACVCFGSKSQAWRGLRFLWHSLSTLTVEGWFYLKQGLGQPGLAISTALDRSRDDGQPSADFRRWSGHSRKCR
jgi:hypothetical protein